MKNHPFNETGIYFTHGHEWIRFSGQQAYIGISRFKTAQTKKIKKPVLVKIYGLKQQGEIFARIQMDFQTVEVHMPVDGTIVQVNNMDRLVSEQLLLTDPEAEGWLVKIVPRLSSATGALFTEEQYYHQYPTANPLY